MIGVVDTSALIRLFVPDGPLPEGFEGFLRGVERGRNKAISPELILPEAANVILKKHLLGELSEEEGKQLLSSILSVPIRLFPHRSLIPRAYELAQAHHLTVYDALYLALAEAHGAVLFSADQRMVGASVQLNLA